MKVPAINTNKLNINKINTVTKKSKATDWKPIKNYTQYMKEYGLK